MSASQSIQLEIFKHLFAAIADEMGAVLRKSSYSPNIKERRDFSCALFDSQGKMISQAAHIPVHLGSMPLSVEAAIQTVPMAPGDMVVVNDPFRGGTHLPDVTVIAPVFSTWGDKSHLVGYVANRAHHADIGGMTAGSMPIAQEIYQEGIILPPVKLVEAGQIKEDIFNLILANVRTPDERSGDLRAQIAANHRGIQRLQELIERYGNDEISRMMSLLLEYTERLTRRLLLDIPDGTYRFTDVLDDDGIQPGPIPISASIRIEGDHATVDFTGSAPQQQGSINAVYAITLSAVYYVFRCLVGLDVPNNSGCLAPIEVIAPPGTVVNARHPAAVAGGNVETSQRTVDVLLGALAQACPDRIPAASQGTMNNLTIGGWDPGNKKPFAYYETIGGGAGAGPSNDGASAVHSHMTNTLNTPVEALEFSYPLQVLRYEIRRNSGGGGKHRGGDGIRRDIKVLTRAQISLISERRKVPPYGLEGGEPGERGSNQLIREGKTLDLSGKGTFWSEPGDVISIQTPGGGGFEG